MNAAPAKNILPEYTFVIPVFHKYYKSALKFSIKYRMCVEFKHSVLYYPVNVVFDFNEQ